MSLAIHPSTLQGEITAIDSKAHVHRLLISAALSNQSCTIPCSTRSLDILATIDCLRALGTHIELEPSCIKVTPHRIKPGTSVKLPCKESGSTYRFLSPIVAALQLNATFLLEGKLAERPMGALWKTLELHGATVTGKGTKNPRISGQLSPGVYSVPGNVSSQFVSGLMWALTLLEGPSTIEISGPLASQGYANMTRDTLESFSATIEEVQDGYRIAGRQTLIPPPEIAVDGDWSNAAFWLSASAASGGPLTVSGLSANSIQGDRAIVTMLESFGARATWTDDRITISRDGPLNAIELDAEHTPDLVPAIALVAAVAPGISKIYGVERLRFKESDRIASVCEAINALGGDARYQDGAMIFAGNPALSRGTVDPHGDHRIGMLATVASTVSTGTIHLLEPEVVNKSYPTFYNDFETLGGLLRKPGSSQ